MIDTHCHLTDEAFAQDAEACILRAQEAGVDRIMLACCDQSELPLIAAMQRTHPGTIFASAGIHPENMELDVTKQFQTLKNTYETMRGEMPIYAIGEIGIDLHWDKTRLDDQLRLLEAELDWALDEDLPVLLHIRDAMPEFLAFLHIYINNVKAKRQPSRRLRGVLHCYNGTVEQAQRAMELADLLLGVGGTVTYKKSLVPEVVKALGLEHIVLETDAPYLAPVPHRGQRNEPAYTADTARYVAQLLDTTVEAVDAATTRNAESLLNL